MIEIGAAISILILAGYFYKLLKQESIAAIHEEQAWLHERLNNLEGDVRRLYDRHGNHLNEHELKIHALERQNKPHTRGNIKNLDRAIEELSATQRANMGH